MSKYIFAQDWIIAKQLPRYAIPQQVSKSVANFYVAKAFSETGGHPFSDTTPLWSMWVFSGFIYLLLKNGQTPASFSFIFGLFKQTSLQFLQQILWKNVHPVYGAGIQTHDLWNMNLLP